MEVLEEKIDAYIKEEVNDGGLLGVLSKHSCPFEAP